jgi:hypothetical protein
MTDNTGAEATAVAVILNLIRNDKKNKRVIGIEIPVIIPIHRIQIMAEIMIILKD